MARVALYTCVLCLTVIVSATGIIALVFRGLGVERAGLREVMLSCAVMCLILAPVVLGPLVWLTLRYQALSAQLRATALTDPLTGAPNRRAFFEHTRTCLGEPPQLRRFSVLVIDVDRFKALNDSLGHEAGDAALVHIVRTLGQGLAEAGATDGYLARLRGEEFVVFLDGSEAGAAMAVADILCTRLRSTPFEHRGRQTRLSVSIGVWSGIAGTVDDPLAQADAASYLAKARGRNRWELAARSGRLDVSVPRLPPFRAAARVPARP